MVGWWEGGGVSEQVRWVLMGSGRDESGLACGCGRKASSLLAGVEVPSLFTASLRVFDFGQLTFLLNIKAEPGWSIGSFWSGGG